MPELQNFWKNKSVLITGGTGSFGRACATSLLRDHAPRKIVILSRDELKQHDMQCGEFRDDRFRWFIGDVRDAGRLRRAFRGVDIVIHAAALKQVPACEYNPGEAIETNVNGTRNVVEAAIDCGVQRVLGLSTDKAVNPANLYGATKLCAEKLIVQGNSYSTGETRLACTRYGNVSGSRGSVVPKWLEQRASGRITITHRSMTRFWMSLEFGVRFVLTSVERMHGGEVFVPKIPSISLVDLAEAIATDCEIDETGIRPGEKLHEILLSTDESRHSRDTGDCYTILPEYPWWGESLSSGNLLPDGFAYASDSNPNFLTVTELRDMNPKAYHENDPLLQAVH